MNGPPEPPANRYTYPVGDERSQIQTGLYNNLQNVPGVEQTTYCESEHGVECAIVGEFNTDVYADGAITAEGAYIRINWWPLHDEQDRHWFQFHYHESSGFDCGFHRHENDHIDGLDHYQERADADDEYDYHPLTLHYTNPIGVLWEILGERLPNRLKK